MAIGDWTEEDVKNGLREPTGGLVGGLDVLDYLKGRTDFATATAPPNLTSASYDLGRRRAAEEAEAQAEFNAQLSRDQEASERRLRELLKDRPDLLAEYDGKMTELRAKWGTVP